MLDNDDSKKMYVLKLINTVFSIYENQISTKTCLGLVSTSVALSGKIFLFDCVLVLSSGKNKTQHSGPGFLING